MSTMIPKRLTAPAVLLFLFISLTLCTARPAVSDGGQVVSGPYSLTIRGGSYSDSATFGGDARADFINPFLNVHLFGTYDHMDASSGLGVVDTQRYGAGFALSHTYPDKANVFIGTSFINELNEYFGHAYLGGKVKVSNNALLSASYGLGLGPDMKVTKNLLNFLTAKSANWLKAGAVYVTPGGFKTNLYYYLIDPGDLNISGLDGQVSYPVTEAITVGVIGSGDLTKKTDIDRDWRAQAFVSYAFGSQRGALIDVALDKNNPIAYPFVINPSPTRVATGQCTLIISPTSATAGQCYGSPASFTASGGNAPYSWSTNSINSPSPELTSSGATAQWQDVNYNYCEITSTTITVTVTDNDGCSATATVTINGTPN